jgi:hypothetical protein
MSGARTRAVMKRSHMPQMSRRRQICDWQVGRNPSPYARLIMGVSSFT